MSKDLPRLGSGLIVRKGEAAPAVTAAPVSAASPEPKAETAPTRAPKGTVGTIAVTVRLDPERYERLKLHGARRRQTNQQIIVAALDAHLDKEG